MQSTQEQRPAAPVALQVLPVTSTPAATRGRSAAETEARWVEIVRIAALAVFPALIAFSVLQPGRAGRVFWTVAIASLPLFFVLAGFHRWRRICPLAFIA